MISLNSSRHICVSESSFKLQKNLYSRLSYADFTWLRTGNNFRRNLNSCIRKYYPRFDTSTTRNAVEKHSAKILKSWSQQLECVIAFRLRRTFQIINVYKKWWGSLVEGFTARQLVSEISKNRLYFTACLAPFFEWSNQRIPSEELSSLLSELYQVKDLASRQSEYPLILPNSPENAIKEKPKCQCIRCQHAINDDWNLFYESKSLKIWRKEHLNYPRQGLYVYKVYGHFPDVTANDFFRVQLDTDYRKEWDPNVVQLGIVDSDPDTNSDVLYWEFLFPTMFHNRDYVYNRRYEINDEKQYMAIVNESVEHPACPEKPPVHRVREYWSHTVIRPTKGSFDEPGIEFTITYFDNPELFIPNYVSVWYSVNGMPDYIEKQRVAAVDLAVRRKQLEKIREKAARDEARLAVLMKDPEWPGHEDSSPPKRVLLY